ncbi:hypothetical protein NHF46_03930 [Arthrobacter alpinus]|nr:hypothetical protein [Arthrobacter alpinus]
MDAFAAKYVVFIEDKTGSHARALLDLMDSYPNALQHFVWKQTAASGQYTIAKQRGYKVWGYFMDGSNGQFERYARRFDYLGIYHGASDDDMKALVGYGLPVICWEIHTRWMRERVLALGIQGLMCSNYPYVSSNVAQASRDDFGSGLRAAGDLPWVLGWKYQPLLVSEAKALRVDSGSTTGYTLGSLGPIGKDEYTIAFGMRWPDALPDGNAHAGVAFGLADDQPYRANVPGAVGGYHLVVHVTGQVELFRRTPGGDAGESLAAFDTRPQLQVSG